MKLALTEFPIAWEDKGANKTQMEEYVKNAKDLGADLVIFPEMTLTGFTMNTSLAACDVDRDLSFVKNLSKQYELAILFGYVSEENGQYYNQSVVYDHGNLLGDYKKIHPFTYGEEAKHYTGGDKLSYVSLGKCNLGLSICYDLRFPEIYRLMADKVNLISVIANWPKERVGQWKKLLMARAIENQCFVAGVNRVGEGGGLIYESSSMLIDPYGEELNPIDKKEGVSIYRLELSIVDDYRESFPNQKDKRADLYQQISLSKTECNMG